MASFDDVVPVLTAPPGWKKTCVTKTKKGGTPGKVTVTFTSETTGEEFTSRSKLEKYLKANPNPGSPSIQDFYWGKDDTPRRSSRLGDEPPSKKARTSPASKGKKTSKKIKSVEEADKSLEEDFETAVGEEKEKRDAVMQENESEKPVEEAKKQDMEVEEEFETAVDEEKEKQDEVEAPQDAVMQENKDAKPVEEGKKQDDVDLETDAGDEKEEQDEIKDPQDAAMQENEGEKPVEEAKKKDRELEEDFETAVADEKEKQDAVMQENKTEKQDEMKDHQNAFIQENQGEKPAEEPHVEATDGDQTSGKDDEKLKAQDEDVAKNDDTLEPQVEVTDAYLTVGKAGDEKTVDGKAQTPPEDDEKNDDTVEPPVDTDQVSHFATAAADQVCGKQGKIEEEGKQVADGEIPTDNVTNGNAYEPKL